MKITELKERFKEDMRYVYPTGLDLPQQMHQFRDIVRVYLMGVTSALMLSHQVHHADMALIADLNWWPDDSWKWW